MAKFELFEHENILSFVKKGLFVSLLMCSVCFPINALAVDDDDIESYPLNDGTELRNALLQGNSMITLHSESEDASVSFTVPNPGQKFIAKSSFVKSWVESNYDLTFMGDVTFQGARYIQEPIEGSTTDIDWNRNFDGSAYRNEGELLFKGSSISFINNKTEALIDGSVIKKPGANVFARGTVYSSNYIETSPDTTLLFKQNVLKVGSRGVEDGSDVYYDSFAQGGGLYNSGVAEIKGNASFVGNVLQQYFADSSDKAAENQGAGVYNSKDITFHKTAEFIGNIAEDAKVSRGAGFYNAGTDYVNTADGKDPEINIPVAHFKGRTIFKENLSSALGDYAYGGGLYNMKGHVIFDGITDFEGNTVELTDTSGRVAAGAGIYSLGEHSIVDFNNVVTFKNNKAESISYQSSGNGVAVYLAEGKINFNGGANFFNNTISAENGYSYGEGAAIQVLGQNAKITFNGDAYFKGNKSVASTFSVGGAIVNYSTIDFNAPNGASSIIFDSNEVRNLLAEDDYTPEELMAHNVAFIQARGGALYNAEGNINFGKGTQVLFKGNKALSDKAKGYGGAIFNDVYSVANRTGSVNFEGDVSFENNEATTGGGAIYNKGSLQLKGKTHFSGNKAPLGGAIYNDGAAQLIISGSGSSMKGNKADLGSHIYNLGSVSIQNYKDTMAIDYEPYTTEKMPEDAAVLFGADGDIYNKGSFTVIGSDLQLLSGINTKQKNKEGNVNVEASRLDLAQNTVYADTVNIKKDAKVITRIDSGKHGSIEANSVSISNDNTALGVVVGVGEIKAGETKEYQILDADKIDGSFAKLNENYLYEVKEKADEKGVFQVRKLTEGEQLAQIEESSKNTACSNGDCTNYSMSASSAWINSDKIQGNEEATSIQVKLSEMAQTTGLNTDDYQDAINALTPESSALITAHASEMTRQISNALGQRFYDAVERSHFVYNGKVHYRAPKETSRVWVHSLYSTGENSGKKPFEMDTMGVMVGAEMPIEKDFKVGVAYSYSNTDAKGMGRDTEIESHTGIVYAQYHPSRLYVNGFAMFGQSTVSEEKNVLSQKVKSDYDVNVAAAEVIAGYKLGPVVVGNWVSGVLSPEAGFRYVYTKQKEYTDSLGQTVESADAHALTGVLGARYTVGYSLSPSIQWYPELRAAVTYDFISPSMDNHVVLLNGATYTVDSEEMDKFGIEIGLKMGFEIDNRTEIGIEYEGLFKGDYTNHTGTANVKYNF